MSSRRSSKCYLCGTMDPSTRDHVPPRGFFPDPKPDNLITVPCCTKCNNSYAADEEAFRLFISVAEGVSPAGAWIRENKSLKSTLESSPKLVENIKRSMSTVMREGRLVDTLSLPAERGKRVLVKITKGLLAHYYPRLESLSLQYHAVGIKADKLNEPSLAVFRNKSVYDSRGQGVFQFRRVVFEATGAGVWIFVFYRASMFLVWHERSHGTAQAPL